MYALRLLTYTPLARSLTRHIYTTEFLNKNPCKDKCNKKKQPRNPCKNTALAKNNCDEKLKKELCAGNKCCSPASPKKPQSTSMCQTSDPQSKSPCSSSGGQGKQKTCPEKPEPCSSKDHNPSCGSKDPANECLRNLQEIQNASARVAEEAQRALKEIENAARCVSKQKEQQKTCQARQPPTPPPKNTCGKFAYFCYLLGVAFLLNLGYCVYKHSEEKAQKENEEGSDMQ